VCDKEYLLTVAMTIQMVGVLIGALVCGQLADMIGRRNVFYVGYFLLVVISLATSFVNSWELYVVCRFAVGALTGGEL
jgi:MFS family permease